MTVRTFLDPGSEDLAFLNQALADQGLVDLVLAGQVSADQVLALVLE